jgi:hypothetical protein
MYQDACQAELEARIHEEGVAMKKSDYYARKLAEVDFMSVLSEDTSDRLFYESRAAAYRRKLEELGRQSRRASELAAA